MGSWDGKPTRYRTGWYHTRSRTPFPVLVQDLVRTPDGPRTLCWEVRWTLWTRGCSRNSRISYPSFPSSFSSFYFFFSSLSCPHVRRVSSTLVSSWPSIGDGRPSGGSFVWEVLSVSSDGPSVLHRSYRRLSCPTSCFVLGSSPSLSPHHSWVPTGTGWGTGR